MRKELRDALIVAAAATALVSCGAPVAPARAVESTPQQPNPGLRFSVPDEPATSSPIHTPTGVATETKTPFPSPTRTETRVTPTATEIPSPTATLTPTNEADSNNQRRILLSQANTGEIIEVDRAPIKDLAKFPWPFSSSGDAILATIGDEKTEAAALSADCVYDVLREHGELGTERTVPGFWKPNERLQNLKAKVLRAKTALSPIPLVNLVSIKYDNKEYDCKEVAAIDRLKGYFQNLTDWDNLPGNVARLVGQIFRDMISGFKGTPAPNSN